MCPLALLVTLLSFFLGSGIGTAQETKPSEPEDEGWLVKALAREVENTPAMQKVTIHDAFEVQVPAQLVSQQMSEDAHDVQFEFGTSTPARCFFWEQELDLASALNLQADSLFKTLEDRLEAKQIFGLDAGAVAGQPYLAADWIFRVASDDGTFVGLLKIKIARKRGHTLMCLHDEPGYSASYVRFFEALVGSLEFKKATELPPEPDYRQITVTKVNGQIVGLEEMSILFFEDGVEEVSLQSTLMPLDKQTLVAADEADLLSATSDGRLKSQTTAESGSEAKSQVTLKAGAGETWTVTGNLEGTELNSKFESAPPLSNYGMMLAARQAFAQEKGKRKIDFLLWFPTANAAQFQESGIEIGDADEAPYGGTARLGELNLKMVLDADGTFLRAESADPSANISLERVFVEGSVP